MDETSECPICGRAHEYEIVTTEKSETQVISPAGVKSEEKISDL